MDMQLSCTATLLYTAVNSPPLPLSLSLCLKTQAEKEEKLAETIYEMNKSYYCDLCEKQYFNYSEYDNHINSHDHHHRQVGSHTHTQTHTFLLSLSLQRLKDLKQWESERRFGGHREEEEKKKKRALYKVAVERAHMLKR